MMNNYYHFQLKMTKSILFYGLKSHPDSYPWIVSISSSVFTNQTDRLKFDEQYKAKKGHLCGGVIVNEK